MLKSEGIIRERFKYDTARYKDVGWMIAFYVHLLIMFGLAYWFGRDVISEFKFSGTSESNILFQGIVAAAVVATAFAVLWLRMIKYISMKKLIVVYVLIMIVNVAVLFMVHTTMAFFAVFLLVITLFYLYFVWDRIPFAEAMIRSSTQALEDHSGPQYVAYVLAIVQILWIIVWGLVYVGISLAINPTGTGSNRTQFFLLISLFWTSEVLKNVGNVTTAGTVSMWWLCPDVASPTCASFKRAMTTSFGSICLGSLIVAIIKAIRVILNQAMARARNSGNILAFCIIACVKCLMDCLQTFMQYFNKYAYTYVAVYGDDFISAGTKTWDLFMGKGFTMLINDDLTGMVLALGCMLGAVAGGLSAAMVAYLGSSASFWSIAIIGALIGGWVSSLLMNVIESAIATTFVCWAEDPNALKVGRPMWYKRIDEAGRQRQDELREEEQ